MLPNVAFSAFSLFSNLTMEDSIQHKIDNMSFPSRKPQKSRPRQANCQDVHSSVPLPVKRFFYFLQTFPEGNFVLMWPTKVIRMIISSSQKTSDCQLRCSSEGIDLLKETIVISISNK